MPIFFESAVELSVTMSVCTFTLLVSASLLVLCVFLDLFLIVVGAVGECRVAEAVRYILEGTDYVNSRTAHKN